MQGHNARQGAPTFLLCKARVVDRIGLHMVSYPTEHSTISVTDFWLIKEAKETFP